jgi:hypothetical protein
MEPTVTEYRDSAKGPLEIYPDAPPSLREVIAKWVLRASVAGLVLSLVIHVTFMLLAYFVHFGDGKTPGMGKAGSEVGLAVMTEGELAEVQDAAAGMNNASIPTEASVTSIEVGGLELSAESDKAAGGGELGGIGTLGGGGDVGGEGGGGGLGGSGGSGGTSFFGVEARGSRFAYVVDVSGSMTGPRIANLKEQLVKSINALAENFSYSVLAFSSGATPLGGRRAWTFADDKGKKWGRGEIYRLEANGETNPETAFKIVWELKPRPDAIYFLTDGEFKPEDADLIILQDREFRIPIHCICLESNEGEDLMKRIARESGGTYTYIRGGAAQPPQRGKP